MRQPYTYICTKGNYYIFKFAITLTIKGVKTFVGRPPKHDLFSTARFIYGIEKNVLEKNIFQKVFFMFCLNHFLQNDY